MQIYVDELVQSGAAGAYGSVRAEQVGARHGHRWCHLFADAADCPELHAFARKIGMRRDWFQGDHYDLVPTKRSRAVQLGAVEVDHRAAVAIWQAQRH